MSLTKELAEEIDHFNKLVMIDRNFMGKMINGPDNEYRWHIMHKIITEMKASFRKIPPGNIPIPIGETFEMLQDFSGNTLLKYILKSLGDDQFDENKALSEEEIENKRLESVMKLVEQCKNIFEKWPKRQSQRPSSSSEPIQKDIDDISGIEKIQIARDYINMAYLSKTYPRQVKTYNRCIFLIQLNCYMRSIGLQANEKGAEINHRLILKYAYDIILFCAPILWKKKVMHIIMNPNEEVGRIMTAYPTEDMRNNIQSMYEVWTPSMTYGIISLQIKNMSENATATPIGELLRVSRQFVDRIINTTDPLIKWK
jgi:hypothetical protein